MNFLNDCKIEKTGGDSFKIEAGGKTDYFIDRLAGYAMHNAPFYYNDVEGDFIIQAKIVPGFKETYDAGGILILDDDSHWIKAAYELTDLGHPSIVTVVTDGVSDDCNGEKAETGPVSIRVSRKGDYWAVHYSLDGLAWKMVRYFSLKLNKRVKAGAAAQSPLGKGCGVVFEGLVIGKNEFKNLRSGV